MSYNHVVLVGNLGQDPEIRNTPTGSKVASFTLATSEYSKEGNKTEWHKIVVWNKTAEIAEKYLKKGSNILIEGRLQTKKWDDADGNKHSATEIIGNRLVFMGKKESKESDYGQEKESNFGQDLPSKQPPSLSQQYQEKVKDNQQRYGDVPPVEDDLPF